MSSRGKNFTERERCKLMELVQKHKHIIENKCTNAVYTLKKNEAWEAIMNEFNSTAEVPRTTKQLTTAYLNMKRTTRQNIANENILKYLEQNTMSTEMEGSIIHNQVVEVQELIKQLKKDEVTDKRKPRGTSSEDRFAGYKGVRDITIKKGPTGLGIMIIEGRHTEAGRGIFVSDLQEGSAAEQGGLQIGDMLLAVNRDSLLNCSYDAAAAKLKQTEGVVILTVCTPNLKDDKADESSATTPGTPGAPASGGASRPASRNADSLAASRPQTPRPVPSPVKVEPPPDPSTAPVEPNKDTVIEINSANEVLGMVLLGGSDTLITGATAIILDIYKSGAIDKDGRLKVGDQILECNGVAITKEMAHERRCLSIKQRAAKMKLTVHRPEPLKYDEVEVELTRKAGRALGLTCVGPVQAPGVYIGELLPGSPAELDGRIQKGDFLVSVDGKDVSGSDLMAAAAALKLCTNKASIKVKRFKSVR